MPRETAPETLLVSHMVETGPLEDRGVSDTNIVVSDRQILVSEHPDSLVSSVTKPLSAANLTCPAKGSCQTSDSSVGGPAGQLGSIGSMCDLGNCVRCAAGLRLYTWRKHVRVMNKTGSMSSRHRKMETVRCRCVRG